MKEVTNLAEALVMACYAENDAECKNSELSALHDVLSKTGDKQTVKERVTELVNAFTAYSSNKKLKKWVSDNVEAKGDCALISRKVEEAPVEKPKV